MKTETPTERLLAKLASARPERDGQPEQEQLEAELPEIDAVAASEAGVTINEANLVALFHGVNDEDEAPVAPAAVVTEAAPVVAPDAAQAPSKETEQIFSQLAEEAARHPQSAKPEAKPEPIAKTAAPAVKTTPEPAKPVETAPVDEAAIEAGNEVESMPEVQRAPSQAPRSYSTPKPPAKPARTERVIARAPAKPPVKEPSAKEATAKSSERPVAPVPEAETGPAAPRARQAAANENRTPAAAAVTTQPASGGFQAKWLVIGGAVLAAGAMGIYFARGTQAKPESPGQVAVSGASPGIAQSSQTTDTSVPPPPGQTGTPNPATATPVAAAPPTPPPATAAKSEPPKVTPPATPAPAPVVAAAPAPPPTAKAAPKEFVPPTIAANRPVTTSTLPLDAAPNVGATTVGGLPIVNTTGANLPAPPRPATPQTPVQVAAATPSPAKTSVMQPPVLVSKVLPVYPLVAQKNHIEGSVVFAVKIGKDGKVMGLQPVSGNQVLYQAAREAIQQWKYTPSTLNGEAREATIQVSLNFSLR